MDAWLLQLSHWKRDQLLNCEWGQYLLAKRQGSLVAGAGGEWVCVKALNSVQDPRLESLTAHLILKLASFL